MRLRCVRESQPLDFVRGHVVAQHDLIVAEHVAKNLLHFIS